MRRGFDGADDFARSVLAMHTGHWLMKRLRVALVTHVVAINSEPMHFARVHDLFFPNHLNVVLGLAGDDAGVTARTRTSINRHPPRITFILPLRVERDSVVWIIGLAFSEVGPGAVLSERGRA